MARLLPHRQLTDDERRAIVAKVDEILGIKPIQQLVKEYENRKRTDDPVSPGETAVPCPLTTAH